MESVLSFLIGAVVGWGVGMILTRKSNPPFDLLAIHRVKTKLEAGNRLTTISANGFESEIEEFMFEFLKNIQRRVEPSDFF